MSLFFSSSIFEGFFVFVSIKLYSHVKPIVSVQKQICFLKIPCVWVAAFLRTTHHSSVPPQWFSDTRTFPHFLCVWHLILWPSVTLGSDGYKHKGNFSYLCAWIEWMRSSNIAWQEKCQLNFQEAHVLVCEWKGGKNLFNEWKSIMSQSVCAHLLAASLKNTDKWQVFTSTSSPSLQWLVLRSPGSHPMGSGNLGDQVVLVS